MDIKYLQTGCKCCSMTFGGFLKSLGIYFLGKRKLCDSNATASVAIVQRYFKCLIVSEPNVGWNHFLKFSTVLTTHYLSACPQIYGLLLECWLLFHKIEESPQNLKWTVTLSTENQKKNTHKYIERVQSCKQIPSSRAVQIVWHLVGEKKKAWKEELHLSWMALNLVTKKHWSNSFPEIRQWFQCKESVYCCKRRLINQCCVKQNLRF